MILAMLVVTAASSPAAAAQKRDTAAAPVPVLSWKDCTASLQPSSCAHDAMVQYLVNLTLPAEGTVCKPDFGPFDLPPPEEARIAPQATLPGLPSLPGYR